MDADIKRIAGRNELARRAAAKVLSTSQARALRPSALSPFHKPWLTHRSGKLRLKLGFKTCRGRKLPFTTRNERGPQRQWIAPTEKPWPRFVLDTGPPLFCMQPPERTRWAVTGFSAIGAICKPGFRCLWYHISVRDGQGKAQRFRSRPCAGPSYAT